MVLRQFLAAYASVKPTDRLAIAIDSSYISKAGKFWSGRASSAKWGLEILGIAALNIELHDSFALKAMQMSGELIFHLVIHLRDDSRIQYLYTGQKEKRKDRPRQFEGFVDKKNKTQIRSMSFC